MSAVLAGQWWRYISIGCLSLMNVSNCAFLHKLLSRPNPTQVQRCQTATAILRRRGKASDDLPACTSPLALRSPSSTESHILSNSHITSAAEPKQMPERKTISKLLLCSARQAKACLLAVVFVCAGALMASLCRDSFQWNRRLKRSR